MSNKKISIPTWEEIEENNKPFIKNKQYKGYSADFPLCCGEKSEALGIDLHLAIDCQNEQFIFKNYSGKKAENIIRFALCNKAGFAVASHKYEYSKEGYNTGLDYLRLVIEHIINDLEHISL